MNNEIIIRAFYSVSYKFLYYASQKGNEAALALAEHVWSTGHQVNLSKAEVLDSHPIVTTRCLLES